MPAAVKKLQPVPTLSDLREEIDRIDAAMHGLLMERGHIVDQLIAVKQLQEKGSAFRPGRETKMMREIVARHKGILPVDIVESIWRVIIATFTHVQAPYCVHGDVSVGTDHMQDVARFHFGFVVPYSRQPDAESVIEAVAASPGDLGLVPIQAGGAWWRKLEGPARPKIIARLPFVERAHHPAALPTYVVSKPVDEDAAVTDLRLFSLHGAPPLRLGCTVAARGEDRWLVEASCEDTANYLIADFGAIEVGSHARAVPHS